MSAVAAGVLAVVSGGAYAVTHWPWRVPEPGVGGTTTTIPASVTTTIPVPTNVSVSVDLQPWARVRILDAKGVAVNSSPLTTPFLYSLAPGDYKFEAENGGISSPETFDVRIDPDRPKVINRPMRGFDVEKTLNGLLGPPRSDK